MEIKDCFLPKECSKKIDCVTVDNNGKIISEIKSVVIEHQLEVYINDIKAMRLICTPTNLIEMTVGRLITERIIENINDIKYVYLCEEGNKIKIFLREGKTFKNNQVDTIETCCSDNRIFIKNNLSELALKKDNNFKVEREWIFKLAHIFKQGTNIHTETHGTHSCFLAKKDQILFCAEDIGRHNAVDKVIGMALLANEKLDDAILFTSGRVPVDMLKKAINSKIPCVISNSVFSAQAIELAREYNIKIIGSARVDRYNIYS